MACMEHWCSRCDWITFNNKPSSPEYCPECGSSLEHIWDEGYDHD